MIHSEKTVRDNGGRNCAGESERRHKLIIVFYFASLWAVRIERIVDNMELRQNKMIPDRHEDKYEKCLDLIEQKFFDQAIRILMKENVEHLEAWEVEFIDDCLSTIPDENIIYYPEAIYLKLKIELGLGRTQAALKWCNLLASGKETADAVSGTYACCASIMMPNVSNAQLLLMLSRFYEQYKGQSIGNIPFSLTNGQPSILRGIKDFSDWGKNYGAVKQIIKPYLSLLLNDRDNGISETLEAELLYEKNALPEAHDKAQAACAQGDTDVSFAAMTQLSRILWASGLEQEAQAVLEKIDKKILVDGLAYLSPAYSALCVRFDINLGHFDRAEEWLKKQGTDTLKKYDYFGWLTRVLVLTALERFGEALEVLHQVKTALNEDSRPLDMIECLVQEAVILKLTGNEDEAEKVLSRALILAFPYGYVRVFLDYGQKLLLILTRCIKNCVQLTERYKKSLQNGIETSVVRTLESMDQSDAKILDTVDEIHPALVTNLSPISPTEYDVITVADSTDRFLEKRKNSFEEESTGSKVFKALVLSGDEA